MLNRNDSHMYTQATKNALETSPVIASGVALENLLVARIQLLAKPIDQFPIPPPESALRTLR